MDGDSDTTVAPALVPEPSPVDRHGRAVTRVTGGGPIRYGEAVQFELEFADGARAKFHAAAQDFPRIVSDLRGFAGVAARAQAASPERPVEVVNPYQATEARTDRVGAMIVVRFPTLDGMPLLVAMDADVAEMLVRGLDRELARSRG